MYLYYINLHFFLNKKNLAKIFNLDFRQKLLYENLIMLTVGNFLKTLDKRLKLYKVVLN